VFRLEAASEVIRAIVPPGLTEAFALLTILGDSTVLAGLLVAVYLLGDDRDRTVTLLCYALVAVALTVTLKEGLALSRPPVAVRAIAPDPGSHGFPSGHAAGATVIYGGLVIARDRLADLRVAVPAAVLIALIALSRVVVGVHYLGDVIAGVGLGLAVLAALYVGGRRYRRPACLVAAAIAVPGVVVTGGGADAVVAFVASLGLFGALSVSGSAAARHSRRFEDS
jgi:membrane-associated phospholipid phosphatase